MRKLIVLGLLVALSGCGDNKTEDKEKPKSEGEKSGQTTPQSDQEIAAADETEKDADAAREAEEAVASIMEEFSSDYAEFLKKLRAAKADEERQAVIENVLPKPQGYADRMLPLVSSHPQGEQAYKALMWMLLRSKGESSDRAASLIIEHHLDAETLADEIFGLAYQPPTKVHQHFLIQLVEKANDDQERLKGVAAYARLMQFQRGKDTYGYMKQAVETLQGEVAEEDEKVVKATDELEEFTASLTDEGRSYAETGKMTDGRELADLLEDLQTEYADVVLMERGSMKMVLGEQCESTIFKLRNLAIGKVAPDIEGEDLDGEEFKLSDYRGKVVVLDFWGDW